jgi:hypothetical protein
VRAIASLAILTLVMLSAAACGGGSGGAGEGTPVPGTGARSSAQRTAEAALASPAPCTAPSAPAAPADATGTSTAAADVNGDGAADGIAMYLPPSGGAWRVRVTLASGYALDQEIEDSVADLPVQPLGGYDIDGDGTEEAFLAIGAIWGTRIIALYDFDTGSCTLARVASADGAPAAFPVGASSVAIRGLICIKAGPGGAPALTRTTGTSTDGTAFEGRTETYTLSGHQLSAGATTATTFTGAAVPAAAGLHCGTLAAP